MSLLLDRNNLIVEIVGTTKIAFHGKLGMALLSQRLHCVSENSIENGTGGNEY